jgi:hypothetical protein
VQARRRLSAEHAFRMRHELKATEIVSCGGQWRRLNVPPRTRFGVYKASLRLLASMAPVVRALGVVVPDRSHPNLRATATQDCWEVLLERLERFCFHEKATCLLVPDAGNPRQLRTMARRKRRIGYAPSAFGGQSRKVPFKQLVDDPSHRDSKHSYPVQWADLLAYAAFRSVVPRGDVPSRLWSELQDARLSEANEIERRRGSMELPGLIVWPSRLRS